MKTVDAIDDEIVDAIQEVKTLRRALVDCLVLPWRQIAVDPIRAALDHQNAVIAMRFDNNLNNIEIDRQQDQIAKLKAEKLAETDRAETYKRIAERNHKALMMPCPDCGRVDDVIRAAQAKEREE